jgi:hypothetical protein
MGGSCRWCTDLALACIGIGFAAYTLRYRALAAVAPGRPGTHHAEPVLDVRPGYRPGARPSSCWWGDATQSISAHPHEAVLLSDTRFIGVFSDLAGAVTA